MKALLAATFFAASTLAWADNYGDDLKIQLIERSHVQVIEYTPAGTPTPNTVDEPGMLYLLAIAGGAAWLLKRRK